VKTLGLVAFSFLMAVRGFSQEAQGDKEKIQGTWKIVSFEAQLPKALLTKEALKSTKVVITADKITFHFGKEIDGSRYKIDSDKKPKTIDLIMDGKAAPGIYDLNGDDLTLCWNGTDGERPAGFTKFRKRNKDIRLLVLKREKK
jgi:uncharacterized protein (TIGR03067 family)